ncbi:MAG: DUF1934 domain-containing protein [Eubacteriales bacterium]|nr:DUF1934 domain-containing protein [Eubacteriales bacterium]
MTKDVLISVRGLQFPEGDAGDDIETVQQGEYYFRNGSHFLLFDEYMEGFREPVSTLLRLKEKELTLTKKGLLNVQMFFEENKKNLSQYRTPYGTMLIGLDTGRVESVIKEHELHLEVDYVLEANYQYVADCHIVIDAREKGSGLVLQ